MPTKPEQTLAYDLSQFIRDDAAIPEASKREQVANHLKLFARFVQLGPQSRILEIGVGSGWFQVLTRAAGILSDGIELAPRLIEKTNQLAARFGVATNVQQANIETVKLPENYYDVVVADSVLEHVPDWQTAIRKAHTALKPGGVFYFCTTNKFSFTSGEYKGVPLYGWLPDRARYWIRRKAQGQDIMLFGVDANQFTYPGLRRFLKVTGFAEVMDYFQLKQREALNIPSPLRKAVLTLTRFPPMRHLLLTFWPVSVFVCRKAGP